MNDTKFCPRCKTHHPKSNFYPCRKTLSAYCKPCMYEFNKIGQKKYKRLCVEYKGGKCQTCGYKKSMAALEFHHRDPKQKDFALGAKRRHVLSDVVKAELDKCDLLCSNCHRELHELLGLEYVEPKC